VDSPRGACSTGRAQKAGGVRGVVGAGAGAATKTRRWCGRPIPERPCVLRGVARAHGEPQWVKLQVETEHARGARRSPARRHGRRRARRPRSVGANATGSRRCVQGDRGRGVPSPWRPCARPTWPRRGHGGAAFLGTTASDGVGLKLDQRPASPPGLRRMRAGVHACARASRPQGRAREREANAPIRRSGDQNRAASYG
jgi:hypothetical protein